MLTRRFSSAFDLFDRLEQQLSQQLQTAERVPAAEVHETPEAYEVVLELPSVDKAAIEVKATERTLLISAERRSQRQLGSPPSEANPSATSSVASASGENGRGPLMSEFRYGTWSRSFRFPVAIERDHLPPLQVTHPAAALLSLADVGAIEWGGERRELLGGEASAQSMKGFWG